MIEPEPPKPKKPRRGRGEGGLRKRPDGRWEGVLDLGWKNGKRDRRYVYGKSLTEARQKLKDLKALAARDELPSTERLTVEGYCNRWLETSIKGARKPRTYDSYKGVLERYVYPAMGQRLLRTIDADDLEALYANLRKTLAENTVRQVHATLHRALKLATRPTRHGRLIAYNPADLVASKPQPKRRPPTVWTAAQARAFLSAAREDRFFAVYVLGLTTTLREGELFGLYWDVVSVERSFVQVLRKLEPHHRAIEPVKAENPRLVLLAPMAAEALYEHGRRQEVERLLAKRWARPELVFANTVGGYLHASNFTKRHFKPLIEAAKVPDIRFHDLRHTAASLLLGEGIHPKVVQELLGHTTMGITMDTYSHSTPTLQKEAVDALERLLR